MGSIPIYGTTNYLEYQHKNLRINIVKTINPYVFKFDNWSVDAGYVADDGKDIEYVSCKDEYQPVEMIYERDHKVLMKCEE